MLYPYGFEPYSYDQLLDIRIDFKALSRSCKAIALKAGRKIRQTKTK